MSVDAPLDRDDPDLADAVDRLGTALGGDQFVRIEHDGDGDAERVERVEPY